MQFRVSFLYLVMLANLGDAMQCLILSKITVQIYDDVRIVEQITLCKLSDASTLLLNRNRGLWRQMQVWSMDTD